VPVRNPLALAEGVLLDEDLLPGSVRERQARIRGPHVAALNTHAEAVAAGEERAVPWFDPASGGTAPPSSSSCKTPSRRAASG
jgi:hypothetical protein